ncbi:MAG: thioredoxin domain-containing protein [bacterium]|nr:thioredoxin domain-containing protein [bacterium]
MQQENLSKKQQKRLARLEKRENQRESDLSVRKSKSALTWLITIIVIIGIVWGLVLLVRNGSDGSGVMATSEEITTDDWTIGPSNAPIQLIEYSDFQCPACASYEPILQQIFDEYEGQIQFAYRHFPLRSIHSHAQLTGQAAEAAGLQGMFWEMHERIFETQPIWSVRPKIEDFLSDLAEEIGLDVEQFEADLKSAGVEAAVNSDYLSASNLGLNATPSFILNGNRIQNPSGVEQFKQLLDAVLAQAELENETVATSTLEQSTAGQVAE